MQARFVNAIVRGVVVVDRVGGVLHRDFDDGVLVPADLLAAPMPGHANKLV
jgi:hypothetical protein